MLWNGLERQLFGTVFGTPRNGGTKCGNAMKSNGIIFWNGYPQAERTGPFQSFLPYKGRMERMAGFGALAGKTIKQLEAMEAGNESRSQGRGI